MPLPEWLIFFLHGISWRMDPPKLFGLTHLVLSLSAVIVPAWLVRRFPYDQKRAEKRLVVSGIVLAVLEIGKQLFYYVVVNNMHYNWWFFPFQLCSMAMYLCLLLPVIKGRLKQAVLTFLFSVSLPGALLALLFPEDMLREYTVLTLHGFLWHGILVYIALTVKQNRLSDFSRQSFFDAAGLYLFSAGIAIVLNIVLRPLVHFGSPPSMFYLSPYEKTGQFFFRDIAARFGIPAEMILYISLYLLLCALFHQWAARTVPVRQ